MGTKCILSEIYLILIINKQTMDTLADIQQPATVRKAGQMEEASWEVRSKEARKVLEAARYTIYAS